MKIKVLINVFIVFCTIQINAQSCEELMQSIQSDNYGTTYISYTSEAISKVTFYDVYIDYQTYYFAIVCFKRKYSYGCNEYIYRVSSNTKLNYALNYLDSAGEAFWKYIQPYNDNLNCAPNFN